MPRPLPIGDRLDLLGLPVHALDLPALLTRVDEMVASGGRFTIGYANVHTINQAMEHASVAEFMRRADVIYCDGNGIRLGAALLGNRLPRRMTGADWIWDLGGHCAARGHHMFWLGGQEGVTARAAVNLQRANPGLEIAGTWHGYFDKEGSGSQEVVDRINDSRPPVVLVGMDVFGVVMVKAEEPLEKVHAEKAANRPQHGEVRAGPLGVAVTVQVSMAVVAMMARGRCHTLDGVWQQVHRCDSSHDSGNQA